MTSECPRLAVHLPKIGRFASEKPNSSEQEGKWTKHHPWAVQNISPLGWLPPGFVRLCLLMAPGCLPLSNCMSWAGRLWIFNKCGTKSGAEDTQSLKWRQSSLQGVNPRILWRYFHCLQRKRSDDHDTNLGTWIKSLNSNWMKPSWILVSSTASCSKRDFYCYHEVILQPRESSKWPPEPTHGRVLDNPWPLIHISFFSVCHMD